MGCFRENCKCVLNGCLSSEDVKLQEGDCLDFLTIKAYYQKLWWIFRIRLQKIQVATLHDQEQIEDDDDVVVVDDKDDDEKDHHDQKVDII
jgi:hypothetical protein